MSAEALNLLWVGGAPATRDKLTSELRQSGIETGTLACVENEVEALGVVKDGRYAAILLALDPLGAGTLDCIASLNLAVPETPILAIADTDDELAARLALRAGADDCLVASELTGPQLVRAIRLSRERREKLAQLRSQAWCDPLTGLPNRALLRDRLTQMLVRARRYGGSIGVLFIDLDDFKLVNDTIGHAGGDLLLCAVAQRLTNAVRKSDTVARLGGDEFVVALQNLSRREDAEEVAGVIEARIGEPFHIEGEVLMISASIGIAMFGPEAENVDALLRLADNAMYRAKRAKPARL